jgi:hypothetical protein
MTKVIPSVETLTGGTADRFLVSAGPGVPVQLLDGPTAKTALGVTDGADGADGLPGADGDDGLSAYQVAVANGFVGDEEAWLASLVGATGPAGDDGEDGATGATGATGPQGEPGEGVAAGGTTGQVLAKASATDYDTEWVNQSGSGASKGFRAVAGHYYPAQGLSAYGTSVSLTANTLYLIPFRFRTTETWTKIYAHVNTAPSAGNLRLGIWCPDDSGDGLSTSAFTLVSDCGVVSMATTGLKEITGLSVTIDANKIYLLSLLSDQNYTALGGTVSQVPTSGAEWVTFGMDTAFNFNLANQFRKTSVTYGALPSTVSGVSLLGLNLPAIGLRL